MWVDGVTTKPRCANSTNTAATIGNFNCSITRRVLAWFFGKKHQSLLLGDERTSVTSAYTTAFETGGDGVGRWRARVRMTTYTETTTNNPSPKMAPPTTPPIIGPFGVAPVASIAVVSTEVVFVARAPVLLRAEAAAMAAVGVGTID